MVSNPIQDDNLQISTDSHLTKEYADEGTTDYCPTRKEVQLATDY